MKYLLILFTTALFSQTTKQDTLFVNVDKADKINIESRKKESCNELKLTLKKQTYFDSLVLILNKSNKRLKRKVNKKNTIQFNDFINNDTTKFLNQMDQFVVFIIYNKKKYYEIKDFIYYEIAQE